MIRKCICAVKEQGEIDERKLGLWLNLGMYVIIFWVIWVAFGALWALVIPAVLTLLMTFLLIVRKLKHHSLKCSLRYAFIQTLNIGGFISIPL